MRIKKWLIPLAAMLAFVMALVLPVPANAAQAYVIDEAGMLTTDELAELNRMAEEISLRQECGVYVVITSDMHGYRESEYAQGIYMNYDLGYGEAANGVLLAISVKESFFDCIAYGAASDVIVTARLDQLNDVAYNYLRNGDWYGCVRGYLNESDKLLTATGYTNYNPTYTDPPINQNTVITSPTQRKNQWLGRLPIAFGGSGVIGTISVLMMRGKNKNIGEAHNADSYIIKNGVKLVVQQDQFAGKTRSVTRIHRDSGGGGGGSSGGGHSYHSSGFSHSSGGRHF